MTAVRVLLRHHWRRHRTALLLLGAGCGLFEFLVTRAAPYLEEAGFLRSVLSLVPAPVLEALGQELEAMLSARGFVGFGYAHPFPQLMLAVWAVRVTSGALAREVGQGTMDLLASRAVTRAHHVGAAVIALLAGLAAIGLAAWSGTAIGLWTRPLAGAEPGRYLSVAALETLLFAAFGALGLAISAAGREGGAAIALTSTVLAASLALDYVARLWAPIRFLRPLTLFGYYEPHLVLLRGAQPVDAAVLAGVLAVGVAAAFVIFARRDL